MKLKKLSIIALVIGVLLLSVGLIAPNILYRQYISRMGTVGIIGAAESDVEFNLYSMFYRGIMPEWPLYLLVLGVALIVTALLCLMFNKTIRKSTPQKPQQ